MNENSETQQQQQHLHATTVTAIAEQKLGRSRVETLLPCRVLAARMAELDDWGSACAPAASSSEPASGVGSEGGANKRRKKDSALASAPKDCMIVLCDKPVIGNQTVCDGHRRRKDNMRNQAKKGGYLRTKAFDHIMNDPHSASEAMREDELTWPDGKRWGKQPALNWQALEQTYARKVSNTSREKFVPWEENQYIIDCTTRMGWTDDDAKTEWEKFSSDPSIERDHFGLKACLRLWLPQSMKLKDDTTSRELAMKEQGKREKLTDVDRAQQLGMVRAASLTSRDKWLDDPRQGQMGTPQKRPGGEEHLLQRCLL